MLARVANNIYQGALLNQLFFKNVGYEYIQFTANKKIYPWSNSHIQYCQYNNMSKDGTKPDVLVKDLTDKQFQRNVNNVPKLFHGSSNLPNIKKGNLKPKLLKRAILQECGDQVLPQVKRNIHSCMKLNQSGSNGKCLVENRKYKIPYKKTVAFDLHPRVLHQCANPQQCTNIHCVKLCRNPVGILKKSKENIARNVFLKPYIIEKSICCAIQPQTRNFCQNVEKGGSSKIEAKNQKRSLDMQDAIRKQISFQISEKNAKSNQNDSEHLQPLMEMKCTNEIQSSFTLDINEQPNSLKEEKKNVLLKTISNSMSNLNSIEKPLVKIPATVQTKDIYKLGKHSHELCWVPSISRIDNRLAFSTSSGDCKDKNKRKSESTRKKHTHAQDAEKHKTKADSSEGMCNPKSEEERTKVLESITPKEDIKNPEEIEKHLESCFPKSEKSNECDLSEASDKTKGTCEKTPQRKKLKCEKYDTTYNVEIGCKSSLQKLCNKITDQITEYTEKKKNKKRKKNAEPCKMTCHDICANDGIKKDSEFLPGVKTDCRFACDDGQNPCEPHKLKKSSKTNICKEMFKKKLQVKKKKCSKTLKTKKKEVKKCPESEKKQKRQKKSSCADICLGLRKALRKKPQLYSGECEKTKKKAQHMRICENYFKKMLRKMQKRKTC